MKKIPTIFIRDNEKPHGKGKPAPITREKNPEAQWVFDGEGIATRKWDGTACAVIDGKFMKRLGEGWAPVGDGQEDKWHREGWANSAPLPDGGYELCGPRINGGNEGLGEHQLIRHGNVLWFDAPRDYDGLVAYLGAIDTEGIVWHHPDGRMAKIKKRDFGLQRKP